MQRFGGAKIQSSIRTAFALPFSRRFGILLPFILFFMPDPSSPDSSHDATIAKVIKNEKDIDKKMSGQKALKSLLENGRVLLSMVKDYFAGTYREVPYWAIGAAALALVYVLSPVDAIPDIIPGLGYLDDATVLAFCLKLVESEIERYKEWKAAREAEAAKV